MKFEPSQDRVLVKRTEETEVKKGGIIIPDTAKEKPVQGKIVAVGPGRMSDFQGKVIPVKYKVGERVLFGKYSGTDVKIDDEEYVMMKEDDVLGTFK
ncbi:MAG TPA: co-chaperone GroES [bacterium]|nr:co-chaperone GroES [bacterium]